MIDESDNSTFSDDYIIVTFSDDYAPSPVTTITSPVNSGVIAPGLLPVYVIISVVGIVGNFLCLVVLLGHAPLRRKPANYFLISQSIVDLIVSFILPLNICISVFTIYDSFDVILCYLWTSRPIFLGLFTASLFNIAALTVERCFKTVHPVQHRVCMTKRRLKWIIVAVTASGVLLKLPYAIGGTSISQGGRTCVIQTYSTNTLAAVVGMYSFLIEYFLPLLAIAVCYIRMACSLRRNIRPIAAAADTPAQTVMVRARRNIFKTLLIVVLIFIVCTTFKQILILAKVIGNVPLDYFGLTFNVSQVMSFMVCCTNPFVYVIHYEEFKVGMRKMFTGHNKSIGPEIGQTTCAPDFRTQVGGEF